MKSAAYEQLCNMGKLEGLKFTYWDNRRNDPKVCYIEKIWKVHFSLKHGLDMKHKESRLIC